MLATTPDKAPPASAATAAAKSPNSVRKVSAAKNEAQLDVEHDSTGHEVFKTKGIHGAAPAHDYHFI